MLPVAASLLELALEGVDAVVDGLFKGVGHLVGKQVVALGNKQFDTGLFVHSGLGFNNFQCHLSIGDFLMMLNEFLNFLVDELL